MAKTYDIAVLGDTPAGYAAAMALARKRLQVTVVQCPAPRTESPLADWAPADLFRTCAALRAVKRTGTEAPFRTVVFHSPKLDRQAPYHQRAIAGYFLRRDRLLRALATQARRAGVRVLRSDAKVKPQLEETGVVLAGKPAVRAAVLLIAQDSPAEVMARLNLSSRTVPAGQLTVWGLDVPLARGRRGGLDNALHVVTFGQAERLGMFFRAGDVLHCRIVFNDPQAKAAAARHAHLAGPGRSGAPDPPGGPDALAQMIGDLQRSQLLPAKLSLARAVAAMWQPPGGVALELETHLAKRTLLTGTAGGFAASLTGQTLDPTVRSALVAANVAHRALASPNIQDALAEYKQQWRDPLADRIRPPGTSLQMLTPMVLSNKAMAARFARAMLYGEHL